MARFYVECQGARGPVDRVWLGHSEVVARVASWNGAVEVRMYIGDQEEDRVEIRTTPWMGKGPNQLLFDGPLSMMQAGATPPNIIGL